VVPTAVAPARSSRPDRRERIETLGLLDKLDPAILIGERFGLWPPDRETVNVSTLADSFTSRN